MNAIVPLNITALRVSPTDGSNVVTQFKGRVANFDNMPYGKASSSTSTGDAVVQLLESNNGPLAPLYTGIHLHWELPDYFRKGTQPVGSNQVSFPQTPNRWLVTRHLNRYDKASQAWQPAESKSWVVESDYISESQLKDSDGKIRPSIPVPLPVSPAFGKQPYRFMGRVLDAATWKKNPPGDQYLKDYNDVEGNPCYLSSIGFLGPGFSTYYPDCCSVFGFCDRFLDVKEIYDALKNGTSIQFKASYQVIGWIEGTDPMDQVPGVVTKNYESYVNNCIEQDTEVLKTPTDFFLAYAKKQFKWKFNPSEITYKLDKDKHILSFELPRKTICEGIMQEIVWNMLDSPGSSSFLGNPETPDAPWMWEDKDVTIAVGNTAIEALSALLKHDNQNQEEDADLLNNYEYLLDALQLGVLNNIENENNKLINLEEALHSGGFAREQGGLLWVVQQKPKAADATATPVNANTEVNLPLTLAEKLYLLNKAQKDYDTARNGLTGIRKQLFMDWYRYIKMYAGGLKSPNVSTNVLASFLTTTGTGALATVIKKGNDTGILQYISNEDDSGAANGVKKPEESNKSLAYAVWEIYEQFRIAMKDYPDWQMLAVPAPPFWGPADPVAVMEGNRIAPARRNGSDGEIEVRLSPSIIGTLLVKNGDKEFLIKATEISPAPVLNASLPYQEDLKALQNEANLLVPSLASRPADVLKAKGGAGNPATGDYNKFLLTLKLVQGGLSGLETKDINSGIYNVIRGSKYVPAQNPQQQIKAPLELAVTFSNEQSKGWLPDAVAWNTQIQYPELNKLRYDPFLPVSLVWQLTLDPLKRDQDKRNYNAANLTDHFKLDTDSIDYQYKPAPFTTGDPVAYESSVVMSKKATFSLAFQISNYETNFPDDPANPKLHEIAEDYKNRKILSQTMSGLNTGQLLRYYIPQIPVQDLTVGSRDSVTNAVKTAALAGNPRDNWYNTSFNTEAPVPTGPMALANFGPLRSGFLSVNRLEIVDVFGQRMKLNTKELNTDGSLKVIPALTVAPLPDDKEHANKIYFPPRLLAPSRLWFRWLSATHNQEVAGVNDDFVEMNTHPATSPVCGWILPNHLDDSLFFYNQDGTAIGSFGVEHNDLKYRTKAGNIDNTRDSLAFDIGEQGKPTVNAHLANFMWYISNKSGKEKGNGKFLNELMQTVLNSDQHINPENYAQDGSLAVLVGRPLAIVRSVVSMETAGNLLPLNQADTAASDPWPSDIIAGRSSYSERQQYSSANMGNVSFPLRLGDLSNLDDGLIGYLIEQEGKDPYGSNNLYAPAAPVSRKSGVIHPEFDTIQLTLNAAPKMLTMLMDPRAGIHATTGVLPVEELEIPADQYKAAMNKLQMTFFTLPVLKKKQKLVVPLPEQSGYVWSWVSPGEALEPSLAANASNSNADWGYSPQTLLEGWLKLSPDPNPAPDPKPEK